MLLEKRGRLAELEELIKDYRIEMDTYLQAIKDKIGIRNVDLSYVDNIDFKSIKVLFKEVERKQILLARAVKDAVMLKEELGVE
jgi:hypothetical protein